MPTLDMIRRGVTSHNRKERAKISIYKRHTNVCNIGMTAAVGLTIAMLTLWGKMPIGYDPAKWDSMVWASIVCIIISTVGIFVAFVREIKIIRERDLRELGYLDNG